MFCCNFYLPAFNKLKGEKIMEFWLILLFFVTMGGSCSLAGTWWSKDKKKKQDTNEPQKDK